MKVVVENIPKDKFWDIQNKILRLLVENGFEEVETIQMEDALSTELLGIELEIKKDESKKQYITSSSACG
ncbi:hypothetical protein [Clostridium butyricum]|jgi:hypothetical protein|uniref:hypothetical protein n=1 Tax=Clostridium butyricum TaxID=1492 RepID=UPI0012B6F3AA|nr:hypothetical protein [Clostridium butyricum]MDU3584431.1 hypothetical protein [Clostridium butyricum]MDU3597729.1 hypothetical protein [Clostridium butyricum]